MQEQRSFWKSWRHEAAPLFGHALSVCLLQAVVLICGLGILGLEKLFPDHSSIFAKMAEVDIWLAFALLILFGVYAVFMVSARLLRSAKSEAQVHELDKTIV